MVIHITSSTTATIYIYIMIYIYDIYIIVYRYYIYICYIYTSYIYIYIYIYIELILQYTRSICDPSVSSCMMLHGMFGGRQSANLSRSTHSPKTHMKMGNEWLEGDPTDCLVLTAFEYMIYIYITYNIYKILFECFSHWRVSSIGNSSFLWSAFPAGVWGTAKWFLPQGQQLTQTGSREALKALPQQHGVLR